MYYEDKKITALFLAGTIALSNGIITYADEAQTETVAYDEQYPLAGMLEQFGLNDTGYSDPMIASANGAWLPYTGEYQYINQYRVF